MGRQQSIRMRRTICMLLCVVGCTALFGCSNDKTILDFQGENIEFACEVANDTDAALCVTNGSSCFVAKTNRCCKGDWMFTPIQSITQHNYTIAQEAAWQDKCWSNKTSPCCPG